jgi:YfiH family protein
MNPDWIIPDWSVPNHVRAICTTRAGGSSNGPWKSMNLGGHCGDSPDAVSQNRATLRKLLPAEPVWLKQVHGSDVHLNTTSRADTDTDTEKQPLIADAQISSAPHQVCAVLTADCLPVLFCNHDGSTVAAAHAGWRGLAAGVLENTVQAFAEPPGQLKVWLGPAIGPGAYEIGEEVRTVFLKKHRDADCCFSQRKQQLYFDLYAMARHCLNKVGLSDITGGDHCTHAEPERFYSYRRDGETGRMASLIWMQNRHFRQEEM